MKDLTRHFAALVCLGLLAGCEGIGDGSTLRSLEVRPADGSTIAPGASYKLYECIRDQLVVIGTFTDGSTADFSFRAAWSSEDATKVAVSDGDGSRFPTSFVVDGAFSEFSSQPLRPGTLIPKPGSVGQMVTISAEFLGLRSSVDVAVGTASFVITPASITALPPAQPSNLGVATLQRFNVLVNRDGRLALASSLNQPQLPNPLLWRFQGGTFVARDDSDIADFDKSVVPNSTSPAANVNVISGTVTGVTADSVAYPVEAQLSLCTGTGTAADANPIPASNVRVVPLASSNPLTIAREADFNGPGVSNGDLALNTNQLLTATANLDHGGAGNATQNLSAQARFNLEPKNSGCDALGLNCVLNGALFFSALTSDLRTVAGTTGGTAEAQACFPFCVATLASLNASTPTPALNTPVTLTAEAVNFSLSASGAEFTFDCNDDFDLNTPRAAADNQSSPTDATATCTYAAPGAYTATVRVTDSSGALAQNAGAVRLRVAAAASTSPVAALAALPTAGKAPLTVTFNAAGSTDADAGDAVVVYEFDFDGDGDTDVSQTSPVVAQVYLAPLATGRSPTVRVVDESGARSAPATVALTVTGTAPATRFVRSNPLDFTAVPATLASFAIQPSSASEAAFTYPSQQFEAIGMFNATAPATFSGGATSASQKITRFVGWAGRVAASDSAAFSEIADIRGFSDDLLKIGQAEYLKNVTAPTDVFVTAFPPVAPLATVTAPTPATLTVEPCVLPVCP